MDKLQQLVECIWRYLVCVNTPFGFWALVGDITLVLCIYYFIRFIIHFIAFLIFVPNDEKLSALNPHYKKRNKDCDEK